MRKTHTSAEVKDRYNRKAYDRVGIYIAKGSRELLQELAAARGLSVNAYLKHLIVADNPEIVNLSSLLGGGGRLSAEEAIQAIVNGFTVTE